MSSALAILSLVGCLIDTALYQERQAMLTDDDGDGVHEVDGDCDDTNPVVYPGSAEICDSFDNDCDGYIDNDATDGGPWYPDADGDGYGSEVEATIACINPGDWLDVGGDCDDADDTIHPEGVEVCNSKDDDCNGIDDDDALDASTWYADGDGDGYGNDDQVTLACLAPDNSASIGGDCDDTEDGISPGAEEVCGDEVDNNCNDKDDSCGWETTIELAEQITIKGDAKDDLFGFGGDLGDVDGDGTDELLIGGIFSVNPELEEQTGGVFVYELPLTETALTASDANLALWAVTLEDIGANVVMEDIDGDGFDDLLSSADIAEPNGVYYSGQGYIHYGPLHESLTLSEDTADWVLWGYEEDEMSRQTFPVGDLDGDGVTDFAMGSAYADFDGINNVGKMYIYTTASSGSEWADDSALAILGGYDESDAFGIMVTGGDLTGDGQSELLCGAKAANYGEGEVYLFEYASLSGEMSSLEADETWVGEEHGTTGRGIELADFNNDGTLDMATTGEGSQEGTAYIVWGGPDIAGGYLGDAPVRIRGTNTEDSSNEFAYRLHASDFNGDGIPDLLVSEGQFDPDDFFLFYGPFGDAALLYDTDADVKLISDHDAGDQNYPTYFSGEVTGDNTTDLLIGSPYNNDETGIFYIVPGSTW